MSESKEILLFDDIIKKYRGLYVAVRVIERDQAGQPLKVEVVSKGLDKYGLRDDVANEKEICIFYAYPLEGFAVIL